MYKTMLSRVVILGFFWSWLPHVLLAQVQVSNLGNTAYTAPNVGFYNFSNWRLASSFTTDSFNYTLNSVSVRLFDYVTTTDAYVAIHSDAGGTIGGVVAGGHIGLEHTISGGGYQTPTFTSNDTLSLTANTTYWMVIGVATTGWLGVTVTDNQSQAGSWSIGDHHLASQNGDPFAPNWWMNPQSHPVMFSVNATVIPEPSTYAVIFGGVALAGAAVWRRRSSRQSACGRSRWPNSPEVAALGLRG